MAKTTRDPAHSSVSTVGKRLDWVDIAKGIATILVIVGHTISYNSPYRQYIFSFHMPLFFILAGFTFRVKPWKSTLQSSCKRLLLPYVLVFLLWWGTKLIRLDFGSAISSLPGYLLTFIFASGGETPSGIEAVGMTWFLAALFVTRILFNGLAKQFQDRKVPLILQGISCLGVAAIGAYIGDELDTFLPLSLDVVFVSLFFFWVGYAARNLNVQAALRSHMVGIATVFLWILCARSSYLELAVRRYDSFLLCMAAACFGTFAVCWLGTLIANLKNIRAARALYTYLCFCGVNGMSMYCLHAMDWWIPWASLPLLKGLPLAKGIASVLRTAYCSLFAQLMKRV